ncbi:MAG: dihydrolipoyl dehydrogenase [Deltaproteobacteria bacterium]|nr:dihydrolipoyl dehydrogenase [Deltaproteobacteria bacterium]
MSEISSYNLIVIGAGIGGYTAAIRASQLGAKVLVVEQAETGGTCLNRGCIPTKAFKATADELDRMNRFEEFGLSGDVHINIDIKRIIDKKNKVVQELVKGVEFLFKSYGIMEKRGRSAFVSKNRIKITAYNGSEEFFDSKRFIIATGSSSTYIQAIKTDGKFILTSDEIMNIDHLPKRLIIIGAGVIGTEFAFIFRSMGVDITMLELMPEALPLEDEDISHLLSRSFKKAGIKLRTGVKVVSSEVSGNAVNILLEGGEIISGDMVLVSIGRQANTTGLGLEHTGIKLGKKSEIVVDGFLNTGVDGIYGCGDVIGGKLLAHTAYKEGIIAAGNMIEGKHETINYNAIPSVIYSTPEAASVGYTEQGARAKGYNIKLGRFPYRALGKARAFAETDGEVKVVVDVDTEEIIGMHIVGAHASDIIAQGAIAVHNGIKVHEFADIVAAHPTYSEAIMEAAEDVFSMSIHQPKKSINQEAKS